MENMLSGALSQLDSRIVYVVVGVLALTAILSIIKKAIKLAIMVFAIAFLISFLGPMAKDIQSNYKFNVSSNGVATVQIKDTTLKLSKDEVKSIEMVNKGITGYTVNLTYKDGIGSVNVPTFMADLLKSYAKQNGIPVKLQE